LQVGLILHALQFQPVEIDMRDVARLETNPTDVEHMIVVGQVIFRQP
jgi:hypothetical protein